MLGRMMPTSFVYIRCILFYYVVPAGTLHRTPNSTLQQISYTSYKVNNVVVAVAAVSWDSLRESVVFQFHPLYVQSATGLSH